MITVGNGDGGRGLAAVAAAANATAVNHAGVQAGLSDEEGGGDRGECFLPLTLKYFFFSPHLVPAVLTPRPSPCHSVVFIQANLKESVTQRRCLHSAITALPLTEKKISTFCTYIAVERTFLADVRLSCAQHHYGSLEEIFTPVTEEQHFRQCRLLFLVLFFFFLYPSQV